MHWYETFTPIAPQPFQGRLLKKVINHLTLNQNKMRGFVKILEGVVKYTLYDKKHTIFQVKIAGTNPDPLSLMFACMDSRVMSSRYTKSEVGENYVVKNAGNFVPYPGDLALQSNTTTAAGALELTCVRNTVRHVVVTGHSDCKAMQMLYDLRNDIDNPTGTPLEHWIKKQGIHSVNKFRLLKEENDFRGPMVFKEESDAKTYEVDIDKEGAYSMVDKLSMVNCIQQLENIAAYPFLYDRLSKKDLFLHALWYDIHTGKVFLLSRKQKQFIEINEDSFFTLMTEIKFDDEHGKY